MDRQHCLMREGRYLQGQPWARLAALAYLLLLHQFLLSCASHRHCSVPHVAGLGAGGGIGQSERGCTGRRSRGQARSGVIRNVSASTAIMTGP